MNSVIFLVDSDQYYLKHHKHINIYKSYFWTIPTLKLISFIADMGIIKKFITSKDFFVHWIY